MMVWGGREDRNSRMGLMEYGKTQSNSSLASDIDVLPPVAADAESLLVQELTKLTVEERNQALEDLHGVSGAVPHEDPEMLRGKLLDLDHELKKLLDCSNGKGKAYRLAKSMDPSFVESVEFRKSFLRADFYDTTAAAKRLSTYLKYKLDLFGPDKLVKEITLKDLSDDDMESLECGALQVLNETDQSGRAILVIFNHRRKYKEVDNMMRAVFYILTSLGQDFPQSELQGMIILFYNTTKERVVINPTLVWRAMQLRHSLPLRSAAHHFCLRGEKQFGWYNILLSLWYQANRSYSRVRMRKHFGTDMECRYHLQSFGIPMKNFPVGTDGSFDTTGHEAWVQRRRRLEERRSAFEPLSAPTNPQQLPPIDKDQGLEEEYEPLPSIAQNSQAVQIAPILSAGPDNTPDLISSHNNVPLREHSPSPNQATCTNVAPYGIPTALQSQPDWSTSSIVSLAPVSSSQQRTSGSNSYNGSVRVASGSESGNNPTENLQQYHQQSGSVMSALSNHMFGMAQQQQQQHFPSPHALFGIVSSNGSNIESHPAVNNISLFQSAQKPPQKRSQQVRQPPEVLAGHHGQYVTPKVEDVLFGRGKPTRNHPGNLRFRNIMEQHADEYNNAAKFVKSLVAKKLVHLVASGGSRFLRPTETGHWVVVEEKVAQDKISQYFRSRRGHR